MLNLLARYYKKRIVRNRSLIAIFCVFAVWGLIDVRDRARIDPEEPSKHRTDLTVYTTAGAAILNGGDPYTVTNIRGWHYLYPP
ncbi:MAG: hypothetical protein ACRD6X_07410, partial [Pyrinomonadaceae bacterium]